MRGVVPRINEAEENMGVVSTPGVGSKVRITLALEATAGTVPAASSFNKRFDFTSEGIAFTEQTIESASIRDTRSRAQAIRSTFSAEGDLSAELGFGGYERLYYASLGSVYSGMENVDVSTHGRLGVTVDTTATQFATFKNERVVNLGLSGGNCAILYRRNDSSRTLVFDNAGGSWYPYSRFSPALSTTIQTGAALTTSADELIINNGPDGETFLNTGTDSGTFELEIQDRIYTITYTGLTASTNTFTVTVTHVNGTALGVSSPLIAAAAAGHIVRQAPCIWRDSGDGFLFDGFSDANMAYSFEDGTPLDDTMVPSGAWILGEWNDAGATGTETMYGHMYEIGQLPPGMTVEILRDVVNFLYTGMRVNTMNLNFAAGQASTATFSLVGMNEYASVKLARECRAGDTAVYLNEEPVAFRTNGGTFSIGEETNLTYTAIHAPGASGNTTQYYRLNGIPSSGTGAITLASHPIGTTVDSRSSVASTPPNIYEIGKIASFEANIVQDNSLLEVLSASITLNNNLATDKFILGSKSRAATVPGRAMVDGQLSMEFDSGIQYRKFKDKTPFSLEIRCVSESVEDIYFGGILHPVVSTFFMPNCAYDGNTPGTADESFLTMDAPFKSYDDTSTIMNGSSLTIFVGNRIATGT